MAIEATEAERAVGRGYEALFVPAVFAAWTRHLIDGAGVGEGAHVLDIACGSGVLARHALSRAGPAGRVVGVDPVPGMLAAAAEVAPGIEWVAGRAEALEFGDGTFDCVLSQFGMMFFEDRDAAAAEMFRVMRPGGRLAVAVWNGIGANPAYADLSGLLDEAVSRAAGDALRLPFSLGDAAGVEAPFRRAGFAAVVTETKEEEARFPDLRTMVEAELRGWLPLFGIVLDEAKIAEVLAGAEARLERYAGATGAVAFPTSAHVLTARKPD